MASMSSIFSTVRAHSVWVIPAIFAFFVLTGGASAPGMQLHLFLQLLGLGVLMGCLWAGGLFRLPGAAKPFLALAGAWTCLVLMQIVPLPGSVRQVLPGGDDIARGFEVIGASLPALPLSLTPGDSFAGLFMMIPPLAVFILALKLSWRSVTTKLPWICCGLAVLSVGVGLFQVSGGASSSAYFYEVTNLGSPVGIFANVNHQAIFLLMTLPFLAAMAGRKRADWMGGNRDPGGPLFLGSIAVIILAGILFAGSLAGYALLAPTILLSLTLVIGRRRITWLRWRYAVPAVFVLGLLGTAFAVQPILEALGVETGPASAGTDLSRVAIWDVSKDILGDFWLTGAGLGAFPDLFIFYDPATEITDVYANHAHNDYLEWLIEFGLVGAILLIAFFVFATQQTVRVWTMKGGHEVRIKRAASIALWLPFLHSIVDYPLRTPAIAVFVALCLAIMIAPADRVIRTRRKVAAEKPQRMSRQVEI
ncbi:MAG: O-antigen ligase family protein [Pseudomonadota bacterium]